MRMFVYEGTPEELARIQHELSAQGDVAPAAIRQASSLAGESKFVSKDVATRILTRRPLSLEQQRVLRRLYDAGENWTFGTQLQRTIRYTPSQFAGLMGAFGRRVGQTEGYIDYTWFFDQEWDSAEGCNRYRLPATVRAAIEEAGLADAP